MLSYYEAILILSWIALIILVILINENNRIKKENKRIFYITYVLVGISSLAEWWGLKLNGNLSASISSIKFAKFLDYTLTPIAGASMVGQFKTDTKISKYTNYIIIFNIVFQAVSLFTGWMTTVDEYHFYHHGPLYFVYAIVYLSILFFVIIEFVSYGKSFKKQNRTSIYAIMVFLLIGIALQQILGGEIRTVYISLVMAAALLHIHVTEFSQLKSDEHIEWQEEQLLTDSLTGLGSRYAYTKALHKYQKNLPDDFVVFSIDVNGLKVVNDSFGHEAGDELICGAASCIRKTFGKTGLCFRTGGDEFIVISETDGKYAINRLEELENCLEKWKGKLVDNLSLAAGFARSADYNGISCEKLIVESDHKMYDAKNLWHKNNDSLK